MESDSSNEEISEQMEEEKVNLRLDVDVQK
ncbi:hypothetical protein Godav_022313, partial [Gossypium davidsonii]|nr:hypothetical protein [Gossypium davidsonii]